MDQLLDTLLTFLFKYPPHLFQRGELALAPALPPSVLIPYALAAALVLGAAVRGIRTSSPRRDRLILGALRMTALAILIACLLRPVLVLSSAVPQRNVLGILLDDSRSMQLADVPGSTRLAAMRSAFGDSARLTRELGDRFVLRYFRFGADAGPVGTPAALRGTAARTDLAAALDAAREELAGVPVAGVILITDGADNAGSDLTAPLLALKARRIPVYPVGVGQERFARDAGIERVTVPSSALGGAGVVSEVAIRVRGLAGQELALSVEDEGRMIAQRTVKISGREDVARAQLRLPPLAAGWHRLAFKIRPVAGEVVTENNEYRTVVGIRAGPEKVLYVEGEPRPELAFLRRALAGDSVVQLVSLLRSAKGKFLRLGVDDSLELVEGFPTRREDLFRYRALILGSIEASFFTGDQLRMLADFVGRRGGGLIALGGRGALAEGGYTGTPLAEVLPVTLGRSSVTEEMEPPVAELAVRLTQAGRMHAALQLGATEDASGKWDSLPPLTSVNLLGSLKPGATTLLTGRPTQGASQPVLAIHRYGRGSAALVGVQDTWLWRMHASMPVDDRTHETFWRQLVRWALDGVPERLEITASPARIGPGEPVTLQARLADEAYLDANDGAVVARVSTPTGRSVEVPLAWTMRGDGAYEGRFVAEEQGVYRIEAEARRGTTLTRAPGAALLVDEYGADVERPELRTPLLRRIAEETGGRYYPLAEADGLAQDVGFTESGVTVKESRDLWDMPIVFLALVALLGTEWVYRRRRGLA
ncbi:MAG: hypothetical protein ACT4PM_06010 [Gemmatimonadales bacterium]